MIRSSTRLAFATLLLAGASLSSVPAAAQSGPTDAATAAAPSTEALRDRLFRLFAQSDEANLKRNPLFGIFRGDLRYADQFGDYISNDYIAAEKASAESELAALRAIPRASLSPDDQLVWDVFEWTTKDKLAGFEPAILAATIVRPINHFSGFHTFYPTFSSGKGAAPFKTVADYENALKRHAGYVKLLDAAIGRFREGESSGVFETKMTIRNVIEQFDTQLAQKVEDSPYYGPVLAMPESFSAEDKARLSAAYRAAITNEIYPAMARMRDYLKASYLPKARDGVGLMHMKGGDVLYRQLVQSTITLPLAPEEIHQTGLREVTRITTEMKKVQRELKFKGTLAQFFDHLRNDPKYKKPTRQALTDGYYAIGKAVDAKLPAYFSTIPKAGLEIRPYEEFREKFEAGGSYESGTPDGTRPGVFYFNAYDLPTRTTPGMATLYLHEGAPGHHFQISLAQENDKLPAFMRFGGNTAYVEGWALYAETLGYDMGFYKDPIARFGTLSDEMLRAMRLVVDTGIHAKGWTRDQAIAYMMSHSDMGKTDATSEVERYIAIPSQALAYKVGSMTIQRLRAKASKALGAKFDIRAFHAQVLMSGALPMSVLEQKIDRWIAATKAG
jgi:uncharacterized protein (DUF885 family)